MVKDKKSKNKEKKKTKLEKSVEKDIVKVLLFLGFLVLVFLVASSFFEGLKSFEYEGLTFEKVDLQGLDLFHYVYYYEAGNQIVKYNAYFRIDPRENLVPVEGGEISFLSKKRVYFSFNQSDFQSCPNSVLAVGGISNFIKGNGYDIRVGTLDENVANNTDLNLETCENRPDRPVIEMINGDETKVVIDELCYKIIVNNCEMLEASEKFKLKAILDGRQRSSN